jgi:hypothetical protein
MLKQVYDKEQLTKIVKSSDVWKWKIMRLHGSVEQAVENTIAYWSSSFAKLQLFEAYKIRGKYIFTPGRLEDFFAINLLDRFIRRIYKVRQSDRGRIIKQIKKLLTDPGNHQVIRLDIKNFYESINLNKMIEKLREDLILAPNGIEILESISANLQSQYQYDGLPRGFSISSTLSELYLRDLDKTIQSCEYVIYSARYVDDIVIITTPQKVESVQEIIKTMLSGLCLEVNQQSNKHYSSVTKLAKFDFLGYRIEVEGINNKPNKVSLTIAQSKINKIKLKITQSLLSHKKSKNIKLLKRRIEYLSMLTKARKGKNGDLLAGIAHNYQYVTDKFQCLKKIDGFMCHQINKPRYSLTPSEQQIIKKISLYGNAINRKTGKFSRNQTTLITSIWKNA